MIEKKPVEARKVVPFRIVPNTPGGLGVYVNSSIDNPDGAEISGEFSTLLLPNIRVESGSVYAVEGTKAISMLLTGHVPKGVDLTEMYIEKELAAQGLGTYYLKVGDVSDHIDVSWAKMGTLDLTLSTYCPSLDMRRGIFDTLDFGYDVNRKVRGLDLRSTTIKNVEGVLPADTSDIQMDKNTNVPENLRAYLKRMSAVI
ncbi:MAG: hypothetical protein HY362_03110 [Candidatus Aenigmarchaeota archaeon]|nr:hypothetical protein [Candidatus Aenigmarchaeota archaeon]